MTGFSRWAMAAALALCSAGLAQAQDGETRGGLTTSDPGALEKIPPRPADPARPAPPSVLAILAHPDDEITIAPVLARVARSGGKVTLIYATSGDAGPGVTSMEPGAALAAMREGEARCAAFALGSAEPEFWRLGDGTLAERPQDDGSPARRLLALVSEAIRSHKPRAVMTWGPDGGYGHGDHRMVSDIVTQVVQGMDEGRPDLLYSAIPSGSKPDVPEFEAWGTTRRDLITDRLTYEPVDLDAARSATGCYESQFAPEVREALSDLLHATIWQGTVHFRLAFPHSF